MENGSPKWSSSFLYLLFPSSPFPPPLKTVACRLKDGIKHAGIQLPFHPFKLRINTQDNSAYIAEYRRYLQH